MKKLLFISASFLVLGINFGQKQGNIWMFGEGAGLDFNSGSPTPFSGGQVFGNPTQIGDYAYSEGCTAISDSSGSLLFYSNGEKLWNNLNNVMPNGDSLSGFYSSTSAAISIPVPNSDSLYYLFTTDGIERYLQNGLRYSVINMCLDGGHGDVISSQKNILLLDTVSEKLCAVAHPNGTDVWLITHKHFTNSFYAFLITPTGINLPVITNIGSIHTGGFNLGCGSAIGQMKASSNGNKIGLVFSNVMPAIAELFDFNPNNGVFSNVISLTTYNNEYGIDFSPDNSKLYTTSINGLVQFDISSGIQDTINASAIQISAGVCLPRPIQLGPDGKIYVSQCSNYLGVINNPNAAELACNYVANSVDISPGNANTSLPNFIAGYNYENNSSPSCGSMGIEHISLFNTSIYPNPFSDYTTLYFDKVLANASILIFNNIGQQIKNYAIINGETFQLWRDNLAAGIYTIQVFESSRLVGLGKLIVRD